MAVEVARRTRRRWPWSTPWKASGYHLLLATRADLLLRRFGRSDEAAGAHRRALTLAPTEPERHCWRRRLAEVARSQPT